MTFVFIRHGEAADIEGRCIGHADAVLSDTGATAVQTLATRWLEPNRANATLRPTRIVSSDLRRAFDSARILAAAWELPIESDPQLREMHFGDWDGRVWSEIEATDDARLRAWTEDWANLATPGGEGLADVMQRARSWLNDVIDAATLDAPVIAVVSHAGWIRAALSVLLELPRADIFSLSVDYARATIVSVGPSGVELIASNVAEI